MQSSHATALQAKHADLEKAIHLELNRPAPDDAMLSDLKRRKLKIKQELSQI